MNVFDLYAKIGLDSSAYTSGLKTLGKVTAGAIAGATAALGALVKQSVGAFAEQEQLIGGVQKLYGNMGMSVEEYAQSVGKSVDSVRGEWQGLETAQNMVLENAKNAYKTAGMSMNQYMDTATSFSAALINSLGGDTVKAAEKTDVAMRAISDNFNTFGGDISMIKGAFQGFAKQNYTMLDNLKLGYGGTKTEMERLIADANEYGKSIGMAGDLSIESFSDVVTAIDLVQQKQGIAGTTAREAATTISGSLGMLRGAWDNLIAGLSDKNADLKKLMDNVLESGKTVLVNIMPVIENALNSTLQTIPELITTILPMVVDTAQKLIDTAIQALLASLPGLIDAGIQIVLAVVTGIITNLPAVIDALIQVGGIVVSKIIEFVPQLLALMASLFETLRNKITEDAPQFLESIGNALTSISTYVSERLPEFIALVGSLLESLLTAIFEKAPAFLESAGELIASMISGFAEKLPDIINQMGDILTNLLTIIMNGLPEFLEKGIEIIGQIAQGIWNNLPEIISAITNVINKLISTFFENLPKFLEKGIEIIGHIASGIVRAVPSLIAEIPGILIDVAGMFTDYDWLDIGINIIEGIASGIWHAAGSLVDAALDAVSSAWNSMVSWLGIASPSKKARDKIGKMWSRGIGIGFEMGMPVKDMVGVVEDAFNEIEDMGNPLLEDATQSVSVLNDGFGQRQASPIEINVYASEGQDEKQIAKEVQKVLVQWENQRKMVFA